MDNDTLAGTATSVDPDSGTLGLPKGSSFLAVTKTGTPLPAEPDDRNGVFRHLVTDDADIAGLVAYSIYKQHKLDWLTAFERAKGRVPDANELASYIIGEGTPRRLATYRHLAEATLAGNGPDVAGTGQTSRPAPKRIGAPAEKSGMTPRLVVAYALVAVLFVVGFLLAAHYTMSSR